MVEIRHQVEYDNGAVLPFGMRRIPPVPPDLSVSRTDHTPSLSFAERRVRPRLFGACRLHAFAGGCEIESGGGETNGRAGEAGRPGVFPSLREGSQSIG